MSEYYQLATVLSVIIGWIVSSYLNKKHEIIKRRFDCRMQFIDEIKNLKRLFDHLIHDGQNDQKIVNEWFKSLDDIHTLVKLFGSNKELKKFSNIVKLSIEEKKCFDTEVAIQVNEFIELTLSTSRKVFGFHH